MLEKIGDYLEIHALTAETFIDAPAENGHVPAVIRGFLHTVTPVRVLYMASLELDNIEMHESFRLNIDPEESCFALPEIKVFDPIRSDDENIGNYKLTLKIYSAGAVEHEFSTTLRF